MQKLKFPLHSCFVALPFEGGAQEEFNRLQQLLEAYADMLSFQNADNPHLTLQFWTEIMEIEYHQIVAQCKRVASKTASFQLKVGAAETFGSRGEDRVLFLSIPFSEELAKLKKSCPWTSGKPFHPHCTLARIRHPQKFNTVKKKIMK